MNKKHQIVDSRRASKDAGFTYIVSLPWMGQSHFHWNEVCADVLEVFGLPGGRFMSHPSMDQMDFYFKSKKDADLCQILISDKL